jgi:hypothetical protein
LDHSSVEENKETEGTTAVRHDIDSEFEGEAGEDLTI